MSAVHLAKTYLSAGIFQVRELGRGQCGRVWQARWRGVDVALKELHAARSARAAAGMLAEAATLARLRHPCVIAFYGVVLDQARALLSLTAFRTFGVLGSRVMPLSRPLGQEGVEPNRLPTPMLPPPQQLLHTLGLRSAALRSWLLCCLPSLHGVDAHAGERHGSCCGRLSPCATMAACSEQPANLVESAALPEQQCACEHAQVHTELSFVLLIQ